MDNIDNSIIKNYDDKQNKISFMNKDHELFYKEKLKILQKYGKTDVYYKSLVYTLGICPTTRDNFEKIFDIKNGKININSLSSAFQTGTSIKATRMAFSLWNECMYDSEKEAENGIISQEYNVSEIFSCSYAPYFYEGVKIRYPEYIKNINNNCNENER